MVIRILGSDWQLLECTNADDPNLDNCDGYCDWTTKKIVVEREMTGTLGNMDAYVQKVKRHEIVHAFLFECGLSECAHEAKAWARDEEAVDWLARMGPKIYEAWCEAGAL